MWYTILIAVHVFSCFFLIGVVLLQQGKGSDVGAVFGGSSQTIFGSSGAGNLLTKVTTGTAVVFMLTSLTLTYGTARHTERSIFDNMPGSTPAPTGEETAPAAQPQGSTATPSEATAPASPPAQTSSESSQSSSAATETKPAPATIAPSSTEAATEKAEGTQKTTE